MQESQFLGCIVGLAVGDALGYPAEFRFRSQLLEEIGPQGITDFVGLKDPRFSCPHFIGPDHPPGTYTDDTQMTIAVAEALLATGNDSLDELMEDLGYRFVQWAESADNNRAPGQTCMKGCQNIANGEPWREAGDPSSKGCGSAMRVAPIGLYYQNLEDVAKIARYSSLLTHRHPTALEGATAAAIMVAMAINKAEPPEMFAEIERRCCSKCADFASTWQKIPSLISEPSSRVLTEGGLGEGWVSEEAVASAMYCFWRHPNDFYSAVLEAINTDGDSDSIGTIAGSVLGARLGIEAIPMLWRENVENSDFLHALGRRLYASRKLETK
jgi:ADP-ribosylglycohydrolase